MELFNCINFVITIALGLHYVKLLIVRAHGWLMWFVINCLVTVLLCYCVHGSQFIISRLKTYDLLISFIFNLQLWQELCDLISKNPDKVSVYFNL